MNKLVHLDTVRHAAKLRREAGALTCAWAVDAATGKLICIWTTSRAGRAPASPVPLRRCDRRAA